MAATEDCTLCALPTDRVDVTDADGNEFCCRGCRSVYQTLDDVEDVDEDDVRAAVEEEETVDVPDDHVTTDVEVDGMHCVSCEAFVESVATATDGVSDARASYVTEAVRIHHDPDAVDEEDLVEAISGLGYTAYPRDDEFRQRQADNWAFVRLGVGVLFGMMVMLQYVTIIYPTYFGGLFYSEQVAEFLAEMMRGPGARYFFLEIGVLTTIILFVTGKPILRSAYVAARMRSPNMELLVALAALSAYAYSVLTIVTGGTHIYFDVTVAIIVAVTAGDYYESEIKREATERLTDLTSVQVDTARRVTDDGHEEVSVDDLSGGDRVGVRAGERIPVDGEIVEGPATVDESVVTGESLPEHVSAGDRVVGGSVVTDGALLIAVDEDATSSLDRIANLAWEFQSGAGGIQGLADRLATVFVPAVLVLAALVAVVNLALGASATGTMLVALTVLLVACPCAMGLATPMAIAAGVRAALDENVVVFDETVFERVRGADTVVFDKTGTLTTGELHVREDDAPDDLLGMAAELESRSAHPVAKAITSAYGPQTDGPRADGGTADAATGAAGTDEGGRDAGAARDGSEDAPQAAGEPAGEGTETRRSDRVDEFENHARGVSGTVDGQRVAVGHPQLFASLDWTVPDAIADEAAAHREAGHLPILVGREGAAEGYVVLGDELREGWTGTVSSLADRGMDVVVLTGDDERAARQFREHDGVEEVFAGVPPEAKAETVARLSEQGETVMVGDGTNDAPALARADLGIALGGGTAMAVDAADVAIVDDDIRSVTTLFDRASATGRRIRENLGWALCYNAVAIPLAVFGLLNPLFAAIAMATSSLLVVTNSTRSLR